MRNRKVQRSLQKAGVKKEERLENRNNYGLRDPTPRQAVENIINEPKR